MLTRRLFGSVVAFAYGVAGFTAAFAQGGSAEPLKLIVPYAAGASTDTLARLVGRDVAEAFKRPVVAENKAGAGGTIAADFVKRQASDGSTFMMVTDAMLSVNPNIYKSLSYDPIKDFTPLSIAVASPLVLVVLAESPLKSLEDIVAKAKVDPGKLTFGSAGVGSSQHMAGELMNDMAGVKITHVPYRGGAPAMADLLGGHIDMMFVQTASAKKLADQGKLRLLGIGSPKRSPQIPDVKTFDELGMKGYDSDTWYGFNMPANVPPAIVNALSGAIVASLKRHQKDLESQGYTVVASTPEEMLKSTETNIVKWRELAKKAGIYKTQ